MQGQGLVVAIQGEGLGSIPVGSYTVVHKQKDPLWYATDTYFTRRGLSVPPEGDRNRLLRGALGSLVIFLDNQIPIHNGPIWNEDVGGGRLEDDALQVIYENLELGDQILVE